MTLNLCDGGEVHLNGGSELRARDIGSRVQIILWRGLFDGLRRDSITSVEAGTASVYGNECSFDFQVQDDTVVVLIVAGGPIFCAHLAPMRTCRQLPRKTTTLLAVRSSSDVARKAF